MIIPDDTPKASLQESQEPVHPLASQSTPLRDNSPPAYYGRTTYSTPQPSHPHNIMEESLQPKQRPSRRFLRALFAACIASLLVGVFARTLISILAQSPDWDNDKRRWEYDIPSGLALSGCVQGSEWTNNARITDDDSFSRRRDQFDFSSHASLTLPIDSDILSLLARGQATSGAVDIVTSPKQHMDTVSVHVRVYYILESTRNRVRICKFSNPGEEPSGVGLFTPKWRNGWSEPTREDRVVFETTITFPEVMTGVPPIRIKGLKVDVPLAPYKFADMNKKIFFDSLVLKGSSASIEVDSLSARNANIGTKNGAIRGLFNATESLVMTTTNDEIYVNVGLDGAEPVFTALTSNGPIEADISLINTSPHPRPSYLVSATTTNSNIHVRFATQPPDSTLDVVATTSNGPAEVYMHPAYEGRFALHSSTAIILREEEDVQDPKGERRERHVQYKTLRTGASQIVDGSIRWGEDGEGGPGSATVRSSNAPLTFEL